ncbi:MAG: hypothetical protein RLZ42_1033 [Armatimonadota bacterium]
MRFDLLSALRKWHLIGALAMMLVAITSVSTTVHALQHVVSASASTINPGDSEACGLCQLETSAVTPTQLSADVVFSALPDYGTLGLVVCKSPRDTYFSQTLRGPPVAA